MLDLPANLQPAFRALCAGMGGASRFREFARQPADLTGFQTGDDARAFLQDHQPATVSHFWPTPADRRGMYEAIRQYPQARHLLNSEVSLMLLDRPPPPIIANALTYAIARQFAALYYEAYL